MGWQAVGLSWLHRLPANGLGRRLAFAGRRCLMLPEVVDTTVWGLDLRLHSRGNLCERRLLTMPQFLDPMERALLQDLLQPGDVFVDVGANIGVYSLWVASRRAPGIRILAIEPDPECHRRLQHNLGANGLAQVTLLGCAISDQSGSASLEQHLGNRGQTTLRPGAGPIPVRRLPEVLRDQGIGRIAAMKVDVEGHELAVLAPLFAESPESAWPRVLITEHVQDRGNAVAELVTRMGYSARFRSRMNTVFVRADLPSLRSGSLQDPD